MRALLVEDHATIAEFVARGLKEAGFVVDHAADGEQSHTDASWNQIATWLRAMDEFRRVA